MGRPSEFEPHIAAAICERIAEGFSLRKICALDELPDKSTVFRWLAQDETFRDQYARAKEVQAELFADEMMAIADDLSGDTTGELDMPNAVAVQRAKLRIDTRKWIASKLLPKKYGDKITQELTGKDGKELQFVVTRAGSKEK